MKIIKRINISIIVVALMTMMVTLTSCEYDETIYEEPGKTTVIVNNKKTPMEIDAQSAAYVIAGKLKDYESFEVSVNGVVKANKGFIKYNQSLSGVIIKNVEETYTESISDSIVKSEHQAFFKNGKVVFRNALEGNHNIVTESDYLNVYGIKPTENILGTIYNNDTIKYAEVLSSDENTVTFKYVLAGDGANALLARQTKEFGGLTNLPDYSYVEQIITVDKNWQIISIQAKNVYSMSIALLGSLECTQDVTYSFSKINETVSIPNTERLNSLIGSVPSTLVPTENKEDTTLGELLDIITQINLYNGMLISGHLNVNVGGVDLYVPVDLEIKISDDLDFSLEKAVELKLSMRVFNEIITIYYCNDHYLYLQIADQKVKILLNDFDLQSSNIEIKGLVNVNKTEDGDFVISLNTEFINRLLLNYGLNIEKCEVLFDIENTHVSTINLDVSVDGFNLTGRLLMVDTKMDYSIDPTQYQEVDVKQMFEKAQTLVDVITKLLKDYHETGINLTAKVNVKLQGYDIPLTMNLNIKKVESNSPLDAINANLLIDITDETMNEMIKTFVGLCFSSSELNILQTIMVSDVQYIKIDYQGNGVINIYGLDSKQEILSTDSIDLLEKLVNDIRISTDLLNQLTRMLLEVLNYPNNEPENIQYDLSSQVCLIYNLMMNAAKHGCIDGFWPMVEAIFPTNCTKALLVVTPVDDTYSVMIHLKGMVLQDDNSLKEQDIITVEIVVPQ